MREPGEGAHDEPHPAERDVHERSHKPRIELCSGAARELGASLGRRRSLLVRPCRRDHVEHVCDRDDASGEGNLIAGDPARVPLAVPAFVVVADRLGPLAEPLAERLDERFAVDGMEAELLPLLVGWLPVLVQDLRADFELPDVVEERGPVQAVEIVVREVELLAEAVRVGANPLRVAARDLVVVVEGGDKLEQDLGRLLRAELFAGLAHATQPLLEISDGAGSERKLESRRRLVREHERELEQRSERQKASGGRIDDGDHSRREKADREPPQEEDGE
jgi:hypothetical protein